jgi:hypothetical protein
LAEYELFYCSVDKRCGFISSLDFKDGPMSEQVTINLNRGLKGMFEGLLKMFPHGQKILDGGAREVLHRAIDQNPEIPKGDITAVKLAEQLGILKPEPKPKAVKRRPRA